jgi:hypothetical protein
VIPLSGCAKSDGETSSEYTKITQIPYGNVQSEDIKEGRE